MGQMLALFGILLVAVNPYLGIGVFVVGVLIAIATSGRTKASPEVAAISVIFALLLGGLFLLIVLAAMFGVLGSFS